MAGDKTMASAFAKLEAKDVAEASRSSAIQEYTSADPEGIAEEITRVKSRYQREIDRLIARINTAIASGKYTAEAVIELESYKTALTTHKDIYPVDPTET